MANPDDIEATEKLLRLIRQGQSNQEEKTPSAPDLPEAPGFPEAMAETTFSPSELVLQQEERWPAGKSVPEEETTFELQLEEAEEASPPRFMPPEYEEPAAEEEETSVGDAGGERFQENESAIPVAHSVPLPSKKESPLHRFKAFVGAAGQRFAPRSAALVIGIDIQPDAINLAKVRRGGKPKLIDCLRIPFKLPDGTEIVEKQISFQLLQGISWFRDAFRSALTELCPPGERYELWCTIGNDFVETHNITLPRLAPREVANAVYWSAKKETNFDDRQAIFDYTILGEILVKGQPRISSVVYLASRTEVDAISLFFSSLGYPLSGITTHSTAIQNQLRDDSFTAPGEAVSHLHLGDHESLIDIYTNGQLAFSRDIKTGLTSFTDPIFELALEQNLTLDENAARAMIFQEDLRKLHENPYFRPMVKMVEGEPVLDLPALGRLVRQLQRTFSYCATNFNISRMSRILISGLPHVSDRFMRQMQQELGVACEPLDPFQNGMLLDDGLAPEKRKCRQFLVSALGLTLADAMKTQNFLCPYQEKEKKRIVDKVNRFIIVTASIMVVVLLGIFAWERILLHSLSGKVEQFREESAVTTGGTSIDVLKSQLITKINEVKNTRQEYQRKAMRYIHMAFAGEYVKGVSEQVRFIKVAVAALPDENGQQGGSPAGNAGKYKISLEGIITAEERLLDFLFADLLQSIATNPFSSEQPVVDSKKIEDHEGRKVLHFVVSVVARPFNNKEHPQAPGETTR